MTLQKIRLRGRSQIPRRPRRRGLLGLVLLSSFVIVVVVVAISCCTSPQCDVTAFTFTFTFAAAFAFGSPPAPARSKKKHGTTTPSLSFLKRTLPPLNNNKSPSNNEEEKDHDHDHQEQEQEEDFSWRMSMESLKSRTKELLNAPQSIPLVMIPGGCILPRQVVTVKVQSPDFLSQVILRQKDTDIPRFGLVAVVRGKNATTRTNSNDGGSGSGSETAAVKEEFLPIGVEVEVLSANPVMIQNIPTSNKFSRSSTNPYDKNEPNTTPEALVEMKVRGIRTFEIVDMPTTTTTTAAPDMTNRNNNNNDNNNKNKWQQQGWIPDAKVQYLDFQRLEAAEPDTFNVALAMQQAQEFTDANNSMKESKNLVEMWLDLARGVNERQHEKQLDMLLEELGEMPSWEEPSECAYWVAALINPTPSMDLAVDIRMGLLTSNTALERTQLVLNALWNSIQRMDASTTPRFFQINTE